MPQRTNQKLAELKQAIENDPPAGPGKTYTLKSGGEVVTALIRQCAAGDEDEATHCLFDICDNLCPRSERSHSVHCNVPGPIPGQTVDIRFVDKLRYATWKLTRS